MLNDFLNAPIEFHALVSDTEWSDPETRVFKSLLASMSDEEFDALENDLLAMEEGGEKSRCIEWLEGYFARQDDLVLAA